DSGFMNTFETFEAGDHLTQIGTPATVSENHPPRVPDAEHRSPLNPTSRPSYAAVASPLSNAFTSEAPRNPILQLQSLSIGSDAVVERKENGQPEGRLSVVSVGTPSNNGRSPLLANDPVRDLIRAALANVNGARRCPH
uniref:Uncharacterized protein n=1 Tax=Panagrolaimus sp. ES5 TaxID=591445 RepID=A0AC34FDU6_9BILA